TGNKGIIYRVDTDHLSTELLNAPPTQVTSFLRAQNGTIYAVTGNVGNLYSIGPMLEEQGTLESDVLDANDFAHWGKAHLTSTLNGGVIELETRSGNVNNPLNGWSPWSRVDISELGGPVQSPPARFLQYRLTFKCGAGPGSSPELSRVDIPFLPKNIAPVVQQIEIAPFNYRQAPSSSPLERSVTASGSPMTLTLPGVGQRRTNTSSLSTEASGSATLQYSKGFVTIRWSASDANGDPLVYRVELRDKGSDRWQLLKDKLQDRFYSFDSAALPDGQYVARVIASDAPGNIPADALTSSLDSDPFTVDNTPPEITGVSITKTGAQRELKFTARDALSWIDKAEYSLDGGDWILIEPDNLVADSQVLSFTVKARENQAAAIRVFDENDNSVVKQFVLR
ncbi:MAG: fibronectin type III domain-containing protein, partial [Acidobacteriaceae bacterium]|nr:fibronectin type III domain-containing protein [Acidobacteriaceae bacterium]